MEITGHFIYKGLMAMQHQNVEKVFDALIKKIKPARVLEIGTSAGGLTLMIRDLLNANGLNESDLRTYDVYDPQYLRHHVNDGAAIDIRVKSMFNNQYDGLIEDEELTEYVQQDGVTLVLCDGGSKKNEFNLISNLIKSGDVIMAHDYSPSEAYFQEHINNKIWNWFEISNDDIADPISRNNLESLMEDEFNNIVWACKIKK
jgi:predicted O-methyltransferase YrrM